jgi:hypothetical protein
VEYTVTAEDGTTNTYLVTVTSSGSVGSINITLPIEDESIGGFPYDTTIYKRRNPQALTITIPANPAYTEYRWFVDSVQKDSSNTITLDALDYPVGYHSVSVMVKKADVYYSKEITFTVVYE